MMPSTNQLISYLITFAVYGTMIGWQVAIILMVGVGFHECGHLWAANRMGLKTRGFFLFPFVGGAALIDDKYRTYSQQAYTVLMGPIWGAGLSFIVYIAYLLTGFQLFGQAAQWMALINLFNLAPLSQLDGGQIAETINYSISETFGIVFMIVSTLLAIVIIGPLNPIIGILIMIYGIPYVFKAYKNWKFRRQDKGYLADPLPKLMNKNQIIQTIAAYLVTGLSLGWLYLTLKDGQINFYDLLK